MSRLKVNSALVLGALSSMLFSSCETFSKIVELDFYDAPDSRVENLKRLHTPAGKHHYTVHFVGDFDQAFGKASRTIGGVSLGKDAGSSSSPQGKPKRLENPSESCLELLTELLEFDSSKKPRLAAIQVAWCARIIASDPSDVSREWATLGLGALGLGLNVAGPVDIAIDAPRADAKQTALLLSELIGSWRALRGNLGTQEDLKAKADAIEATVFDLNGARRVLPAVAGVMGDAQAGTPGYQVLADLLSEFKRRTIEMSLAHALNLEAGSASRTRAAVVTASVEAAGPEILARFMSILNLERRQGPDRDELLVARILELVAKDGLPATFADMTEEQYVRQRQTWAALMVSYAMNDLSGFVRVKAMQALIKTTDGPNSLREEDWENWFYTKVADLQAAEAEAAARKEPEASPKTGP